MPTSGGPRWSSATSSSADSRPSAFSARAAWARSVQTPLREFAMFTSPFLAYRVSRDDDVNDCAAQIDAEGESFLIDRSVTKV